MIEWVFHVPSDWGQGFMDELNQETSVGRLRAELYTLRAWIREEGRRTDTCTFNVLGEVCEGCRCKRAREMVPKSGDGESA